jgi:hypothetical protein
VDPAPTKADLVPLNRADPDLTNKEDSEANPTKEANPIRAASTANPIIINLDPIINPAPTTNKASAVKSPIPSPDLDLTNRVDLVANLDPINKAVSEAPPTREDNLDLTKVDLEANPTKAVSVDSLDPTPNQEDSEVSLTSLTRADSEDNRDLINKEVLEALANLIIMSDLMFLEIPALNKEELDHRQLVSV